MHDQRISDCSGRALCITGVARSGTTFVGNLISSADGVEYAFEPPAILRMILTMEKIPIPIWKLLYEGYLFDEILMGSLSGRRLNFNAADDSFIFHAKALDDIRNRFVCSHRYNALFERALQSTIAYKIPDILPWCRDLTVLYPEMRLLVMLREPDSVVASLMRKGWFSGSAAPFIYGLMKRLDGEVMLPASLRYPPKEWNDLAEIDRCYFFYARMYENLLPDLRCLVVDYDRFLAQPDNTWKMICGQLDLCSGPLTESILKTVARRSAPLQPRMGGQLKYRDEAFDVYSDTIRLACS